MQLRWIAGIASICTSALSAQEVTVFGVSGRADVWDRISYGAGMSVAAFGRLGDVFAETTPMHGADIEAGIRVGISQMRGGRSYYICADGCDPQIHRVQARLRTLQILALLVPRQSARTRLEAGGGMARHSFSGGLDETHWAVVATLSLSRRVSTRAPFWAALGYDHQHRLAGDMLMDDSDASAPRHVFRLGASLRR